MTAEELLHDLAFFQNRIDGRLSLDYEKGWNNAIDMMTEKARAYFADKGIDADTDLEELWQKSSND